MLVVTHDGDHIMLCLNRCWNPPEQATAILHKVVLFFTASHKVVLTAPDVEISDHASHKVVLFFTANASLMCMFNVKSNVHVYSTIRCINCM